VHGAFRFRGPLPRRRWRRVLRRLGEATTVKSAAVAAAGGAIYVAAASEPNVSGVWIREDGTELRLHHVGRRVTGFFEGSTTVSFAADYVGDRELAGYIRLIWLEEAMREECGALRPDDTFRATVNADYDRITYRWTRPLGDQETCRITALEPASGYLRREL